MGIRPVDEKHKVSQPYGSNPGGLNPSGGHTGTDYAAPKGTPVVAIADGRVFFAGRGEELPGDNSHQGYASRLYLEKASVGNGVITEHDNVYTTNSHLDRIVVQSGASVKQGQVIGYIGDTGLAFGDHLHFEIIPRNANWTNSTYGRVNPAGYVSQKFFINTEINPPEVQPVAKAYVHETKWTTPWHLPRSAYGSFGPKPKGITIHHWGSDDQDFDNVAFFLSDKNRDPKTATSAHYVVQDGRIATLAVPEVATFHSGHSVGNGTTVGIEMRPEATQGDVDTLVQLIYELEQTYGSMNIYMHKDWFSTACPGRYGAKIPGIIDRVNAMHKNGGRDPGLVQPPTVEPAADKVEPIKTEPVKKEPSMIDINPTGFAVWSYTNPRVTDRDAYAVLIGINNKIDKLLEEKGQE